MNGKSCHFWQTGRQLSSLAQGGKSSALPGFAKGHQGSGLPGSTPRASLTRGPGRTLRRPPSCGVSRGVPLPMPWMSVCSSPAARTGQSDICLWKGDLVPVPRKAEFALNESMAWFGGNGQRDLAQLAVDSTSAFSAHSYCQGSFSNRADLNNSPSLISFRSQEG